VEKCVAEELKAFLEDGPLQTELDDAKRAFLESQKVGRTGDASLAGQIIANLQLGRKFSHTADMEKKIAALTPEDVRNAFGKYIDPKKLVIIRAGDLKRQ
jgi:zinc protease